MDDRKTIGWANAQVCMIQHHKMKNQILLDGGSSTTVFCNKQLCDKIYYTGEEMIMYTNGGPVKNNL